MVSNGIGDLNKFDFVNGGMYPGSQINHSAYANPTQAPLGAQAVRADYDPETNPLTGEPTSSFANGGIAALHFDGTEGSQVEDVAPAEPAPPPTMSELADQLKSAYRTGTNYDDLWKQFAATKDQDPTEWYKKQLDFLGQQQGWQIGQNRSDRLAGLQPQIDNTIAEAKAAGVSDKEINSILGGSSQEGRNANVQRIATLADMGGTGFNFQKDLQPGLTYLALATAAAATANPEILGLGETGAVVGAPIAEPALGITSIAPEAAPALGDAALNTTVASSTIPTMVGDATSMVAPEIAGEVGANAINPATGLSWEATGSGYAGGAGAVGSGGGGGAGILSNLSAEDALLAKMLIDSSGAGGQGGAGGSTTTTTPIPFSTNQNNPNSLQYNPNATNTIGGMSPNSPYYGYAPLTFNYDSGIKPMALRAPNLGYNAKTYAQGGIADLGGYAAGGKLLKGPGDGMSDSIVANIGGKQPARLADGEFVIPADVVSHLGNGSTDAGAKQLYKMLDRIRHARTGNKKQGKQINPNKFLPKG